MCLASCGGGGGGGGSGSSSSAQVATSPAASLNLSKDPCRFLGQSGASWDPTNTTSVSFDPAWVAAIRTNPAVFAEMVGGPGSVQTQCVTAMRTFLSANNAAQWSALTAEGVKLVIATAFAYEAAPYGVSDPGQTTEDLLEAGEPLACNQYVALAMRLYFWTLQANGVASLPSGVKLQAVGWRIDPLVPNPVGNHAQLFATGVGVNMLLDPTSGIIAPIGLNQLINGLILDRSNIVYPLSPQPPTPSIADFPQTVVNSLTSANGGLYTGGGFIFYSYLGGYQLDSTEASWYTFAGTYDWVDKIVTGPATFYTTGAGGLWQLDSTGIKELDTSTVDIMASPTAGTVYTLGATGALTEYSSSGATPVNMAAAQIAASDSGAVNYLLTAAGALYQKTASTNWTPIKVGIPITAIATGLNNNALYILYGSTQLTQLSGGQEVSLSGGGVAGVTSLRNGQAVIFWTTANTLYGVLSGGGVTELNDRMSTVLLGAGRWTMNILQTDGNLCRADLNTVSGGFVPGNELDLDNYFAYCTMPHIQSDGANLYTAIQIVPGGESLEATTSTGSVVVGLAESE